MSQNEGTGQRHSTRPGGRPGAMTVAMQAVNIKAVGPKVLRIGVIQGGRIVEERIIRKRETVTVGGSERNHFVISAAGLAARFELFQLVGNDYILNFTSSMSGRVGLPAGVQTLEQLRTSGAARDAGSHWQVKLNDSARGKVVIGDVTLLFQFVTPPPVQPRPQLPAAARGGIAKSIDWVFTAFVMFSFMTHFGFVVYLENADWPVSQTLDKVPEYVHELIIDEPEPPPPPEEAPAEEGPKEEAKAEEPAPTKQQPKADAQKGGEKKPGDESKGEPAETPSERSARIADEAAASAEAMLLGALGSDKGGALADVLKGGAATDNAQAVLDQAGRTGVASSASGAVLRTRSGSAGGSGQTGSLGSLKGTQNTGESNRGGEVTEKAIKGTVRGENPDITGGQGDFDQKLVVAAVKSRLRAVQICYEQELRRNPALSGKVTVQFTIEVVGTVSKATAIENTTNDPQVASCVVNVVKGLRFNPGPEGGSVTFSYPFVFAPQG